MPMITFTKDYAISVYLSAKAELYFCLTGTRLISNIFGHHPPQIQPLNICLSFDLVM